MKTLYHYTKAKHLKSIIENGILMNSPESFNDPYDCILFHDEKDKKEIHKLIKNYVMFLVLADLLTADYYFSKIKDRVLVNTVKKEIECTIPLLKRDPNYTYLPFLNKITDIVLQNQPTLLSYYQKTINEWDERISKVLDKTRKNTIVASFSRRYDSVLMWSHYSNHHEGICIEYQVEEDNYLRDVDYSNKLVGIKLKKAMSNILALDFLKKNNITVDNKFAFDNDIYNPFFC